MAIEKYLERRQPYDTTIRFVSERRKVALDPGEIRYVESYDSEVRIHTVSGEIYRTKTRISQWEAQLDGRFLRIHRSYIVNTERIDRYLPSYARKRPPGPGAAAYSSIAAATRRIVGKASRRCSSRSAGAHHDTLSIPSSVWGAGVPAPAGRSRNQCVRLSSQRAVFANQ